MGDITGMHDLLHACAVFHRLHLALAHLIPVPALWHWYYSSMITGTNLALFTFIRHMPGAPRLASRHPSHLPSNPSPPSHSPSPLYLHKLVMVILHVLPHLCCSCSYSYSEAVLAVLPLYNYCSESCIESCQSGTCSSTMILLRGSHLGL